MHPDPTLLCQRGDLFDRVDQPVGVVARGPDQRDRLVVDQFGHRGDVRGVRLGQRRVPDLDVHPVGALVQSHMGGDRHDHVGLGDAAFPRGLAVGVERGDQALGTAAGDHATCVRVAMQQIEHHRDDLALELRG